jgi:hypothetical protein
MSAFLLPSRQVHLDFHTSPFIDGVAAEFDAKEFARTMRQASVNSVTVFSKCHHGMCYYPTQTGVRHPHLGDRDLLGEMIEALHREGIRAPIYTTVAWEEDVAQRFPEWRQMRWDGRYAQLATSADGVTSQPAGWRFNNFLHPDYQDYFEAHLRELIANYEVDGFFLDIVFFDPQACWSETSRKFREKHGLLGHDAGTQARFQSLGQEAFAQKFSAIARGLAPKASIFYNAQQDLNVDARYGPRARARQQSHLEIESLPSGFWGYHHFPRIARGQGYWGKPWIAMTGRFQRMWGDFGGIKPQAALEFECFRAQALGGGNSVGDQMHPRGKLDPSAYALIGAVFAQCAAAEPFYKNSTPLPQVGIVSPNHPDVDPASSGKSEEGAVQICEELHYDVTMLDDGCDLAGLDLVILPDEVVVTAQLKRKLRAFAKAGGPILSSGRSGFDETGAWSLGFLPYKIEGACDTTPTYWRTREAFDADLSISERVCYEQGHLLRPAKGAETLVERVLPYFQRTDLKYCSHFQAPPRPQIEKLPAAVGTERFIAFADPIFRELRQSGNLAARRILTAALQRLIGPAPFGHGLSSSILSVPRQRGNDLILTLLHYIPVRKALDIDVIDEARSFAGELLSLPPAAKEARLFGAKQALRRNARGQFALPAAKGRLLVEVPGFFR